MVNVLFSATDGVWETYEVPLRSAFSSRGLDVCLSTQMDPGDVDYIVFAPNGPVKDFTPFTRTKAVLGLWAGVESIVGNETLTQPLARMVDPGLTKGMVEWVCGHVLRHHLGMDADIVNPEHDWVPRVPPLAEDTTVAVLGVGALGLAVCQSLKGLEFDVVGWSRRAKPDCTIPIETGPDGLTRVLQRADYIVLLLPQTAATLNTLDDDAFAKVKPGAYLINPGRGPLIDDDALLRALDAGTIAHATLDVFRIEPLPQDHAFWTHPKVTVTPHIASATRPETASNVIADNIRRCEDGLPLVHVVDRNEGY